MDLPRTRAALLNMFANNTEGDITPQKHRDLIVTIMDQDFAQVGDFWAQPLAGVNCTMLDKTVKGWILHSQLIASDISFGKAVAFTANGWVPADAASYARNIVLGITADSYVAGISTADILRKGLIYDNALSAKFSGNIGRLLFLQSDGLGTVSVTVGNSARIMGYIELSAWSDATSGKWRFEPDWTITGE